MPRLLPDGPGLAVSPDHAWLAVAHDGHVQLIDTATREVRATCELKPGPIDVYLSNQRLFAFVRMEGATGCYTFSLPKLEAITSMELIGHAIPLGGVQDRVLVVGPSGEMPRVLALMGIQLTSDPMPLREPVLFAAEAPDNGLLVCARDQIECWDPMRRRALFRLHLPVTSPKLGGFASRRRQLWVVSASSSGPLEVFRYSDGRIQARADLGKRVLAVDGHPESPRLVVAARSPEDPQPELVQFDLSLGERNPVKVEGTVASFAVVDGHKPVLVVGRVDGSIDYVALPRATPLDVPQKTAPKRDNEASALADRLTGWRNRLAGDKGDQSEMAQAARRLADPPRRREEPRAVRPVREVAREERRPEERRPEERPPEERRPEERRPEERRSEERPPEEAPLAIMPFRGGWRGALCAWATAALDSGGHAAPPPEDERSTLATASARLDLAPAGARALALLYGQWLLGDGERGVPLATLAQVIDDESSEEDAAWMEALLRGSLGRARLCKIQGGRVRLRPLAARFLDGRPARLRLVPAPPDARPIPFVASQRLEGERDAEEAAQLAEKLGRQVALIASGPAVEAALAEARLFDAVPLVNGTTGVEKWAPLLGEQPVICAFDGECPELRALPLLD
jgi:hypothetical protein